MRIGLVLGAGGALGGVWMAGALHGLSEELGWDPTSADRVVGTSAGAMVGALLSCGVSPGYLAAHCAGEELGGLSAALTRAEASRLEAGGLSRGRGPGSWALALGAATRPYRYTPAAVVTGWLPRGRHATEPLKEPIRMLAGGGWSPRRGYRAVACDYATARRETLGAMHGALADAVAASCAIPGFYRPVSLAGRRFVDGAVHSTSNLDVLAGSGLDLVICLNPMSSPDPMPVHTVWERAMAALRRDAGRRLAREARAVRESGTETLLIQPTAADLEAMSHHDSDRRRVVEVARAAVRAS